MGVSCTVYSWDKSPGGTGGRKKDCRFAVVNGQLRGTAFPGGTGALRWLLAEDPLKAMPGVRIPQSDAEAWVKGLVWFLHNSSEMAAIMDDGSIPPIPTARVEVVSPPGTPKVHVSKKTSKARQKALKKRKVKSTAEIESERAKQK
jgi:hypothetical protein